MSVEAWLTVLVGVLGGAIRVSTPFLWVSLGECITERAGRINLGLEGPMVFGAMFGYAVSYHSGSAWVGVLAAGLSGVVFGLLSPPQAASSAQAHRASHVVRRVVFMSARRLTGGGALSWTRGRRQLHTQYTRSAAPRKPAQIMHDAPRHTSWLRCAWMGSTYEGTCRLRAAQTAHLPMRRSM
jgi:hypothetical protein